MKKTIAIILCIMLLLTACQAPITDPAGSTNLSIIEPPASTKDTTEPPAVTTDPPEVTTDPVDTTTAPIEIPAEPLSPAVWRPAELDYLSYEELFSEDKKYANQFTSWAVVNGDIATEFSVESVEGRGLIIKSPAYTGIYQVPGSESLQEYSLVGADGHWAYLINKKDIIRADMLTGEVTKLAERNVIGTYQFSDLAFYYSCREVMYFVSQENGFFSINRLYLPTLKLDVLHTIAYEIPDTWFFFNPPKSTLDTLRWYMLNPEMHDLVKQELANPNSVYKTIDKYTAACWDNPTLFYQYAFTFTNQDICMKLQEDTGVAAFLVGNYNCANDIYTEIPVHMDECWAGSEIGHDCFDPEAYDIPAPEWDISDPVTIPSISIPDNAENMNTEKNYGSSFLIYTESCLPGKLSIRRTESSWKILDISVMTITRSANFIYGITPDNTIIQVSNDGTVCNTIYTAQFGDLKEIDSSLGSVFALDGNKMIEIDVPAGTWRTLMSVSDVLEMYFMDPGVLYIECRRGRTILKHLCMISTGEIRQIYFA